MEKSLPIAAKYISFSPVGAILLALYCLAPICFPRDLSAQEQGDLQVNRILEYYARNFSFRRREVIIPQHPVLGELIRPSQLGFAERAIYWKLVETRFWNDLDFDDFSLDPVPAPPFRRVTIGELNALGSQRYEVPLELESFDATYFLDIVLLYNEEDLDILLIRHLQAARE